jgi:membrane-bound metal-dependent hydrolase YbcI (DUF457 family)
VRAAPAGFVVDRDFQEFHYMPLPVAHGLLGASIVAATLPDASPLRNWKPLLFGASLSISPDLDYFLGISWHRGITHSLIFAAVISMLCLAATGLAQLKMAIGYAGALFSHALLDYATTKDMPGVELLWPFSTHRFGLGLVDYYHLTGVDPVFFLNRGVVMDLFKMGMLELIIFLPVFLFVLSLKWSLNKRSHP